MLDITDLSLIRVSFTCLKAVAFDDNAGVNRYTGRHVTPITIAVGSQLSAKFENTMWELKIACRNDAIINSARGCGMRERRMGVV